MTFLQVSLDGSTSISVMNNQMFVSNSSERTERVERKYSLDAISSVAEYRGGLKIVFEKNVEILLSPSEYR